MPSPQHEGEAGRIRIDYRLTCAPGEDVCQKAQDIAFEQTVELPETCVTQRIREATVGEVGALEQIDGSVWKATILYPPLSVGSDVNQLVNLLFGNVSLKAGIRVTDLQLPPALMRVYSGPRHGISGLRQLCGVSRDAPLSCAALKPMGSSAAELAQLAYEFALGGIDIIKDDHGLSDQQWAPFRERVERCSAMVDRANRQSGGHSLYFPNLPSSWSQFEAHLEVARSAGVQGILVSPMLIGLDAIRFAARQTGVALLAHPALTGAFFQTDHGIAPELLLGKLFRLIGCDAVIYPNVGGRFVLPAETCAAINASLREPWGPIKPAFPVPAGGIDASRVGHWLEQYGPDTIFLIGGSLYSAGDLVTASRNLMKAIGRR
jgi:ribulose-bisphosphate carboxylase large chain